MALLADVMAGRTKTRLTDQGIAYAALSNVTDGDTVDNEHVEQTVALTIKAIQSEDLSLRELIAYREKEEGPGGAEYRRMRHAYLDLISGHVADISRVTPGSADRVELDRLFERAMEDDFYELKRELGFAVREAWLNKDVIVLAVAGAALLAGIAALGPFAIPTALTAAGTPVTIGGLAVAKNRYSERRRQIMRANPLAYVWEARRR